MSEGRLPLEIPIFMEKEIIQNIQDSPLRILNLTGGVASVILFYALSLGFRSLSQKLFGRSDNKQYYFHEKFEKKRCKTLVAAAKFHETGASVI